MYPLTSVNILLHMCSYRKEFPQKISLWTFSVRVKEVEYTRETGIVCLCWRG